MSTTHDLVEPGPHLFAHTKFGRNPPGLGQNRPDFAAETSPNRCVESVLTSALPASNMEIVPPGDRTNDSLHRAERPGSKSAQTRNEHKHTSGTLGKIHAQTLDLHSCRSRRVGDPMDLVGACVAIRDTLLLELRNTARQRSSFASPVGTATLVEWV